MCINFISSLSILFQKLYLTHYLKLLLTTNDPPLTQAYTTINHNNVSLQQYE